jgi:hypothetical protein
MSSDVKTEETAASDQPFIGPVARVQPGILLNGSLSVPSGQLVNGKTHGKDLGGFINGSAPIAGWFIMENPIKMDDDPFCGKLNEEKLTMMIN